MEQMAKYGNTKVRGSDSVLRPSTEVQEVQCDARKGRKGLKGHKGLPWCWALLGGGQ